MALDITVNLTVERMGGSASFGIPLILAGGCGAAVEYTKCKTLQEITTAFADVDSADNSTAREAVYNAAELLFKQSGAPKTIAVAGLTGDVELDETLCRKDWRQLIVVNPGSTTIYDIAKTVEAYDDKMFFASITIDGADSMTDTAFKTAYEKALSDFAGKDMERTVVMYYDDTVDAPEAALVGATAGKDAGSITYKNIILKGVPALDLSRTRISIINGEDSDSDIHGLTVVTKAGDIVTSEGKTIGGEYIDIIDSRDWIIQNIEYNCQKIFNNSDKVPYTTPGITQLEDAVLGVLKTAFLNGMIAPTEDNESEGNYSTDFAAKADMSDDDIKNRRYTGGKFSFELAGAIHEAEINGTITLK